MGSRVAKGLSALCNGFLVGFTGPTNTPFEHTPSTLLWQKLRRRFINAEPLPANIDFYALLPILKGSSALQMMLTMLICLKRGICFRIFVSFFCSWLFGFLAFRLLGFLVFRLLGFLAFWLLVGLRGFWWLFGFGFSHHLHSPVQTKWRLQLFAGLCGFWRLWLFASSAFPVPLRFIGFFLWLSASSASPVPSYLNHHFFEHHGRGLPPPQPPRNFLDCLQRFDCTLFESSLLQTSWACRLPPSPRYFLDFLQRLNCTPIWFITFSSIQFREKMLQNKTCYVIYVIYVIYVCLYVCTCSKSKGKLPANPPAAFCILSHPFLNHCTPT